MEKYKDYRMRVYQSHETVSNISIKHYIIICWY